MPDASSTAHLGRHDELAEAASVLTTATTSRPTVAVVSGGSGTGKTRFARELLSRVPAHARELIEARPPDLAVGPSLTSEATTGTALTAPDAAGRRLADIVDRAAERFTVVHFEDAHWADPDTRRLLNDLGHRIRDEADDPTGLRLAVVVTMRPNGGGEIADAIENLIDGAADATAVRLSGLDEVDVNRWLRNELGGTPSGPLIQAVMDATGGTPLLVEQAVATLRRQGSGADLRAALRRFPDDVRSMAAEAVEACDPDLRRLLAAVSLARRATPVIVAVALGVELARVRAWIERAVADGLLEDDDGRLRLRHPSLDEAVAETVGRAARRELHADLARAILPNLPSADTDDDRVVDAAAHLVEAGRAASGSTEAGDVVRLGAERALAAGQYRFAARCAEAVVDWHLPTDPTDVVALHWLAAMAHFRDHSGADAADHVRRGLTLARHADDLDGEARLLNIGNLLQLDAALLPSAPADTDRFLSADTSVSTVGPGLLAQLWNDVSETESFSGRLDRAAHAAEQAEVLAEQGGGHDGVRSRAACVSGIAAWMRFDLVTARERFEASRRIADADDDPWSSSWGTGRLPLVHLLAGRPGLAAEAGELAGRRAADHGDWSERALAVGVRITAAVAMGRHHDAVALAELAYGLIARSNYVWALPSTARSLAYSHAVRGDLDDALGHVDRWDEIAGPAPRRLRRIAEAIATGADPPERTDRPWSMELTPLTLGHALWIAESCTDANVARSLVGRLRDAVDRGVMAGCDTPQSTARLTARLARLVGDLDLADAYAQLALTHCRRNGASLEETLAAVEVARVSAALGSRDRAERALREAADLADRLDLRAVGEAIDRLERSAGLRASRPSTEEIERTVLFTDIVDSTPLTSQLGDDDWIRVLSVHDRVVRSCIAAHGGRVFASTGDGVGAWFASPPAAVDAAVAIRASIAEETTVVPIGEDGGFGVADLAVRIGLAHGRPLRRGRDLTGIDVARAVRVMSEADGGEIVVDDAVAEHCGEVRWTALPPTTLKGLSGEHQLHRFNGRRRQETSRPDRGE